MTRVRVKRKKFNLIIILWKLYVIINKFIIYRTKINIKSVTNSYNSILIIYIYIYIYIYKRCILFNMKH